MYVNGNFPIPFREFIPDITRSRTFFCVNASVFSITVKNPKVDFSGPMLLFLDESHAK